jgi:glycerophosphoryl diester phosphodiesterase
MHQGLPGRALADFSVSWKQSLSFHLLMNLIGVVIFAPFVGLLTNRLVSSSGQQVISNFDIAGFVLSPQGAIFVLVIFAMGLGLLLAEFAGLSWLAGHAIARQPATVATTIGVILRRLPKILALSTRVFLRLLLAALPFLAVASAVYLLTLQDHDINYYLAESPPEWRRARLVAIVLGLGFAVTAGWLLLRWIYALPVMLFEKASAAEAMQRSVQLTRGRRLQIAVSLLAWWLLLTATAVTVTWLSRFLSDALLDWAGIDVHRVLPLLAVILSIATLGGFLYSGLQMAGHQFLVTRLYAEQVHPARRWRIPREIENEAAGGAARSGAVWVGVAALLASVLVAGWFLSSRLDLHEDVCVTAHRGASTEAPENTIAALRRAMEAGADYAEIDVQHTKDREIVLLHDADLMRMGGDARRLENLALADLESIDLGRNFGAEFAGEHAPTLAEAIDTVRGRMKLNIELKYNVPDPGLVSAVIELLRKEDFLDQAVITSLDYQALRQVMSIEPALKTGHIVTASVGDVMKTEADFLSLNSAKTNAAQVRRAHAAGKEVHVWTVNDPEAMLRMIERGVDNIITDRPEMLVNVMRRRNELSSAEMLGLRLRILFSRPPLELVNPKAVAEL